MLSPWVREEVEDVDLQDKRLNTRLALILDQLGGHPPASIPAGCGGYAETMAAYRFFDNEKVGFEKILHPHIEASWRRMAEQPIVVLAQDTSEVDWTRPNRRMVGAGPLDSDSRRGALIHPMMGFTPDGTPLGTVYAEAWVRDDDASTPKSQRASKRKHTPIEAKESVRWVDAYRHVREQIENLDQTHFVSTADSEADVYELLEESQTRPENLDWIVRACQNRALREGETREETGAERLRERVLEEDVLFTQAITVRAREAKVACETRGRRQPRESRRAEVEVRAARVTLRAPWRHDRKLDDVALNVVLVSEVDPPADDTPIEWILLTSLPIDNGEQVRTVIRYYCVRWMIEVFFRVLKSGCRVEERQFEHVDRALSCLAVYLIVTWRTLFVCRLGREMPDVSCEAVFEPAEWKSVYHIVRKEPPPKTPPKLQEMVRMVAQLGGYVNRKRKDEPGPQTVWLGLQRTHDIAACWLAFGPESKNANKVV